MQWTVTAPIEPLRFIVATPTRGPFNAQIGDTIDRNGHYLGMHYSTDHWHDRPQRLQPPALMQQPGKHAESPGSQILGTCRWMAGRRGARCCGDAAPLPTQTGPLRGVTFAESNLLLKIRIYNESPGGTKLLARTATGLHYRSRLKSCMEISQKKSASNFQHKKRKGKHFMFQENAKKASAVGKCTNIYISPFFSSWRTKIILRGWELSTV